MTNTEWVKSRLQYIVNYYNLFLAHPARIYTNIQGVPGGMCQTSGECSLC